MYLMQLSKIMTAATAEMGGMPNRDGGRDWSRTSDLVLIRDAL